MNNLKTDNIVQINQQTYQESYYYIAFAQY